MKKLAAALCVLLGVAALTYYLISYFGGRAGTMLAVFGVPAPIVPFLISLVSLGALLLVLLIALIQKRDRTGILLCTGLGLLFFVIPFLVKPERGFQAGLRARINSQVTPEDLRQIATEVRVSLPEGDRLPGPMKKNLWSEEYRQSWEGLVDKTAIDQLDPSMIVIHRTEAVEIAWGEGRLTGRWGVTIEPDSEGRPGDIAPGIQTYLSDH